MKWNFWKRTTRRDNELISDPAGDQRSDRPAEKPIGFTVGQSAPDLPFIRNGIIPGLVLPDDAYICNSCGVLGQGEPPRIDLLTAPSGTCLTCGRQTARG